MVEADTLALTFAPLTADRWADFEQLFGARGACEGCWCTFWRLPRPQYNAERGEANRETMRALVESGVVPGLLAYAGGEAVGWCSVGPRDDFPALDMHTKVLRRVDDLPVWSVVCFFVAKPFRRRGLTGRLLEQAIDYARQQGATILEGYPAQPKKPRAPGVFEFTGLASTFRRLGFVEVARRSETRPIMRYYIGQAGTQPAPPECVMSQDAAFHYVCTHEEAKALVDAHRHYRLGTCRCRAARSACARSRSDLCLHFAADDEAPSDGLRVASRSDVEAVLREAADKRLVARPFRDEETLSRPVGICFCCDDCCAYFLDQAEPCDLGAFIEHTDTDACTDCGSCVDVCHFGARTMAGSGLAVQRDRCFGCGLCRDVCPAECIVMELR